MVKQNRTRALGERVREDDIFLNNMMLFSKIIYTTARANKSALCAHMILPVSSSVSAD